MNSPLVKGGDGVGEILRRLHAVAQPSGGCREKRESRESMNRYRERRQHLRTDFEDQNKPCAFGALLSNGHSDQDPRGDGMKTQ